MSFPLSQRLCSVFSLNTIFITFFFASIYVFFNFTELIDTFLVYALGISDLILASRTAANRDASLVPMFLAGAIYLIMIGLVTIVAKKLKKKYSYYR